MVKNPNWLEVNQLAILQAWWRIWTSNYQEQVQLAGLQLQITSPVLGHAASFFFFTPHPHNLLHSSISNSSHLSLVIQN